LQPASLKKTVQPSPQASFPYKVVTTLLQTRQLAVDAADLVWQAVRLYQSSDAGFADCLIERQCHAVGIGVVTFDKSAAKAGMALLLK